MELELNLHVLRFSPTIEEIKNFISRFTRFEIITVHTLNPNLYYADQICIQCMLKIYHFELQKLNILWLCKIQLYK